MATPIYLVSNGPHAPSTIILLPSSPVSTETANLLSSDTLTLSLTESSTIYILMTVGDTATLYLTETTAIQAGVLSDDPIGLSIDDASATRISLSSNDTVALSISDTSATMRALASNDTAAVSIIDSSATFVARVSSDTATVTATESRTTDSTVGGTQTVTLSITEAKAIMVSLSSGDSSNIYVGDPWLFDTIQVSSDDTAYLLATEVAALGNNRFITAPDSLILDVQESSSIEIAGLVQKSSTDQGTLIATEATITTASLENNDTSDLSIDEETLTNVRMTRADNADLSVDDDSATTRPVSRSDSLAVSIQDESDMEASFIANDSSALEIEESVYMKVDLTTGDTAHLSLDEYTEFGVDEPIPVSSFDLLSLEVSEYSFLLERDGRIRLDSASEGVLRLDRDTAPESLLMRGMTLDMLLTGGYEEGVYFVPSSRHGIIIVNNQDKISLSTTGGRVIQTKISENSRKEVVVSPGKPTAGVLIQ